MQGVGKCREFVEVLASYPCSGLRQAKTPLQSHRQGQAYRRQLESKNIITLSVVLRLKRNDCAPEWAVSSSLPIRESFPSIAEDDGYTGVIS
jgi:hypothetical protein